MNKKQKEQLNRIIDNSTHNISEWRTNTGIMDIVELELNKAKAVAIISVFCTMLIFVFGIIMGYYLKSC